MSLPVFHAPPFPSFWKTQCPAGNEEALAPGTNRNFKARFVFVSSSSFVLPLSQRIQFHHNTTHLLCFWTWLWIGDHCVFCLQMSRFDVFHFKGRDKNPKFMHTTGHPLKPKGNVGPLCGTQQPRFALRSSLESPRASAKWLSVIYFVPPSEQNCSRSLHCTNGQTKVVGVKQGKDLWEIGSLIASS